MQETNLFIRARLAKSLTFLDRPTRVIWSQFLITGTKSNSHLGKALPFLHWYLSFVIRSPIVTEILIIGKSRIAWQRASIKKGVKVNSLYHIWLYKHLWYLLSAPKNKLGQCSALQISQRGSEISLRIYHCTLRIIFAYDPSFRWFRQTQKYLRWAFGEEIDGTSWASTSRHPF